MQFYAKMLQKEDIFQKQQVIFLFESCIISSSTTKLAFFYEINWFF